MSLNLILGVLCAALYFEAGRVRLDAVILAGMLADRLRSDGKVGGVRRVASFPPRSESWAHAAAALTFIVFWPLFSLICAFMPASK